MNIAKRMELFNAYLGTEMNVRLTKMKEEGRDVINLGLGDPDVTPPQHLLDALRDAVCDPHHHHYPSFYSNTPLKEAIASWYKRRFNVTLDPDTEVVPLLGSSEGLYHIHTCLLDVGDIALVPDPSYPSYEAGVKLAGGQVEPLPLLKENCFLPDLDAIPSEIANKAKMIWINYPNNPTAAVANPGFYRKLIDWAEKHHVAVVHDNPYTEICFDGYLPPSFLEFSGAKDVGVEFHSLSKSYNCCGWRAGMVVGNKEIIAGMAKIKSHSDRGMYYPLQIAATKALNGPVDFMKDRNQIFQERRDVVVKGLREIGFEVPIPKATFYIWSPVPKGYTSREFCLKVLDEINVWMIPGSMYGRHGEGYFRIALTHPVERLAEAMDRLKEFIARPFWEAPEKRQEMRIDPSQINILARREIKAGITEPLIRAFMREFGPKKALTVVRQVIESLARETGGSLAKQMEGNSIADLARGLSAWAAGDSNEMDVLEFSSNKYVFNVKRCRDADVYKELGMADLGVVLSCRRDFELIKGFNPRMKLDITKTIMEGHSHCDFRISLS
ncbi:MAG: LL-diaminopimelate aminotransferase [Thermodesulfobacteriota bacterium]|jgi:LL-diaminopimelate aminotransferase